MPTLTLVSTAYTRAEPDLGRVEAMIGTDTEVTPMIELYASGIGGGWELSAGNPKTKIQAARTAPFRGQFKRSSARGNFAVRARCSDPVFDDRAGNYAP